MAGRYSLIDCSRASDERHAGLGLDVVFAARSHQHRTENDGGGERHEDSILCEIVFFTNRVLRKQVEPPLLRLNHPPECRVFH